MDSKTEQGPRKKGFGSPASQPKAASKPKRAKYSGSSILEAYRRTQHRGAEGRGLGDAPGDSSEVNTTNLRGVLLVGFAEEETSAVRSWFSSIEPGFKVACCQEEYLGKTMGEVFEAPHGQLGAESAWQAPRELVPRAAIFSGMTKDEMLGVAEFWSSSGVKDPIFSSNVAAVRRKSLREVLLEIAQAYAQNLAPKEEKMTAESLKAMVRQRMDAKRQAGIEDPHPTNPSHSDRDLSAGKCQTLQAAAVADGSASEHQSKDEHLTAMAGIGDGPKGLVRDDVVPVGRDVRVFEPVGKTLA